MKIYSVCANIRNAGKNFSWLVKVLKKWKEAALLLTALEIVMFIREIIGIGCPIRWLTGISCAGCGMTRAILYAVCFQFDKAFYYHPLFWVLPFGGFYFLYREKIPTKFQNSIEWITVICFGAVYLTRLFFSDHQVVAFDMEKGLMIRLWNFFT